MYYFVRAAVFIAWCLGFLVITQVVSILFNIYLGVDEYIIWFISGVLWNETVRKLKLCP